MKICIYGAGAIGGYLGSSARARGRRRQPGRARRAPCRDARARPDAARGRGEAHRASALHRRSRRARRAGLHHHHAEGALDHRRDRDDAAVARTPHPHRHRRQRHPLLVLPQARRPIRELDAGEHRPRRTAVAGNRRRARHRLHRLSRHRDRGARRDPSRLRQQFSARRALRRDHPGRADASPISSSPPG